MGWKGIESAPIDETRHVRGLWVTVRSDRLPERKEWREYIGFIDGETGRFIDCEYLEGFGWEADDFSHWMPLPEPPK